MWNDNENHYLGSINIPADAFHALPDHPAQRETVLHAHDLLRSSVLEQPCVRHAHVAAVIIASAIHATADGNGNGRYSMDEIATTYASEPLVALRLANKLDGHTRDYFWHKPEWEPAVPAELRCDVFVSQDVGAAARLYSSYDSQTAVKDRSDTLQSTLRMARIYPQSDFIKAAKYATALELAIGIAVGSLDIKDRKRIMAYLRTQAPPIEHELHDVLPHLVLVQHYRDALLALDAMNILARPPSLPIRAPGYVGAYLAILSRDPERGREFLEEVRAGEKQIFAGPTMNTIYAIRHFDAELEAIGKRRRRRGNELTANEKNRLTSALVLNCYERWVAREDSIPANDFPYEPGVLAKFDPKLRKHIRQPKPKAERKPKPQPELTAQTQL